MNHDDDLVWSCPVHGADGCPLDCEAANAYLDECEGDEDEETREEMN